MSEQNAVIRRIQKLTKHWNRFTEQSDAHFLRWRIDPQAGRMIDAFLAFHGDEASELSDLFFPISIPATQNGYWLEVFDFLKSEIEDSKGDLESLEIPIDWKPPAISAAERRAKPADAVVELLKSYQDYYQDYFDHVTLVLMPEEIESLQIWTDILDAPFKSGHWSPAVRMLVLDWTPDCRLSGWADKHGSQVVTQSPVLDINGLPLEILQQLKSTGPGAEFRSSFIQLNRLANGGAIQQVQNVAERAIQIAVENQWFALVAVVHLVVGSTMAKHGEIKQMIEAYRAANRAAYQISVTDPSRVKMMLASGMAEASGKIAGAEYREARNLYHEAAIIAERSKDPNMAFEAHRMACFCAQQSKEFDVAWEHARSALSSARNIDGHIRSKTTVPYLLNDLERMLKAPGSTVRNFDLQRECEQLLGKNYYRALEAAQKSLNQLHA